MTESALPDGWDLVDIDCEASTGSPDVDVDIVTGVVTFTLNAASDSVDCTYTNRARATLIVEKITDDGFGSFDFTSSTLTPSPFTLTTSAANTARIRGPSRTSSPAPMTCRRPYRPAGTW